MPAQKLSVYIICYNNEDKIKDCLESVKWAEDIVVLDSFSTDKTVEICRQYTDRIYQEKFNGFGKLRNAALSYTKYDWILSVDTDERVTEDLKNEIFTLLDKGPGADAYYVPRKTFFLDKWIKHCGWYPDYRQPQFFNKNKMKYKDQLVHESYELDGKVGYMKEHVIQYPFFSLDQYLVKMDRYSSLRAKEMHEKGIKFNIFNLIVNPLAMFFRMYVQKAGFMDGKEGFMLSLLYSYYTMIKYIKLWEKVKVNK
jgi:glycosyltransferase involved in cell wall biosynthesis